MKLQQIFRKPIDRPIEGVIKADDESHLLVEVEEYVITNEIGRKLQDFFDAYNDPTGSNGVWISGFFGSGKSHLLKMLSLLLENRTVDGQKVAELFLSKAKDEFLKGGIQKALRIPSRSILFNIDQKAQLISKDQIDILLSVFVQVFNDIQGYYAQQGYIAEFERQLDQQGKLAGFKKAYEQESGQSWESHRDVVASMENETFARAYSKFTKTSYDEALRLLDRKRNDYKVSIESFAEQVKAFVAKQPNGFRLNFFVDEVGQFIGQNSKLMLNLQTIAETLATRCNGRAWVFVTSQGDLNTVLGELEQRQANDFTKIQGRFQTRLNLTSQDVAEVICERLLAKKPDDPPPLLELYKKEKDNLRTLFQFGDGSRNFSGFKDETDFCATYPFHPYQFDLFQSCILALSRHNAFTGRYMAIGERSMLGVFQEVAKSIKSLEIGHLATFDMMFEGLRNALRGDVQTAVQHAERHLTDPLAVRILKALFLLKWVKEFKATPRNIAILLIDRCDINPVDHEKRTRGSLNRLEYESYVQRSGDLYEFLTDEEKDIEVEIKNTDIDASAVNELIADIAFRDILRDPKVRFEDNKQDYSYARRLDGALVGREYELAVHVVTPLHENYEDKTALVSQSLGKSELLSILPADVRLMDDLRLYKKTEKYVQQNNTASQSETRKQLLVARAQQNVTRRKDLKTKLSDLLVRSRLVLNGTDLEITSTDPVTRVIKAFQELVRFAYPNLRMLKAIFKEEDIPRILEDSANDLFKGDNDVLSEAEQEILTQLQRAKNMGERTAVDGLLAKFQGKPYGWYQAATLCNLAKLFMRDKVEMRSGGNLLGVGELKECLSNNRQFAATLIHIQEQFDATAVNKLKKFHQDFFNEQNTGTDAKEAALQLQNKLKTEVVAVEGLLGRLSQYPFLTQLQPCLAELKQLAGRDYTYYLKSQGDFVDKMLDLKEQKLDPIKQFINGNKRVIYDEIVAYLAANRANFPDIPGDEPRQLETLIASDSPYQGNAIQQAKTALDGLKAKVSSALAVARKDATEKLQRMEDNIKTLDDFAKIKPDQHDELFAISRTAIDTINSTTLLAVIRDTLNRYSNEGYQQQLRKLGELAAARAKEQGKVAEAPAQYIAARSVKVAFNKAYLETDTDVKDYVEKLREAYLAEVKAKKRITL